MTTSDTFIAQDADQIAWGHLVKAWAKGEVPQPASIDELCAQCAAHGIAVKVPEHVTDVAFVQNDKHVLTVRLPAHELATDEALPSWYGRFFTDPAPNRVLTEDEKRDLQAARLGEYSVNNCA